MDLVKFKENLKTSTVEELAALRSKLIVQAEKHRVALNKTRSVKSSEQFRITRNKLGLVNTEIHLRS